MKFLAFDQLGPNPIKPNFMVNILRKISGLQKLLVFFHEIVATKMLILDRTKFVLPAGVAIVFAELITTVSPPLFLGVPTQ